MKSRGGRYLLSTLRHTVIGVARSKPTGPHSHVQKAMATSRATSETPALWP
jgi:hypothetical protein